MVSIKVSFFVVPDVTVFARFRATRLVLDPLGATHRGCHVADVSVLARSNGCHVADVSVLERF